MTGTVELLPAQTVGVDYSFGRPSIADMLTLGVQFASRYICIDNALTHDKLVTLDEIRRLADAGILMMVNYEQSEGTTLGGDAAGRKHGKVAADWRHFLQMPPELPIVISTDLGVTSSQYPAITDFCAAFKDEAGPIGHYHGTTLCAHLEGLGLCDLTWMAMATSWSPGGETPAVHVRQKGYVLGSCDANYVRKPTPFWNFNGDPPLEPKELDMVKLTIFQVYNGEQLLDAVFVGLADDGWVTEMSWCDEWRLGVLGAKNPPCPIQQVQLGQLAGVVLNGHLPFNDRYHTWTGLEFFRYEAPGKGEKGDPGRDAPIPIRFEPVYG